MADAVTQVPITVADRMVMIDEEVEKAPCLIRCSSRLNFGKASKEFISRKAANMPNYQAVGGQKEMNNLYLASLAQEVDGYIAVIDAGRASTTYAMLEAGVDGSDIMAVNFGHDEMKEMTQTLYKTGDHNVYTYEGCFLEFLTYFDGLVGLAYADFTWCCPDYNTPMYWKYVIAIQSLSHSENIMKGTIFAFTHSLPMFCWKKDEPVIHQNIISTLGSMFDDASVVVELVAEIIYRNTEAGGKLPMSFVVLKVIGD